VNVSTKPLPASHAADKKLVLRGLYPATVTTFNNDFSVDYAALERHLTEVANAEGVKGLVVNGGVAELLQLTPEEQRKIVEMTRRIVKPDQLVIAGVEGRSAKAVIEAGLNVKMAGADALLVMPPFDVRAYRRLAADEASVVSFFSALDKGIDLPMIIFQYPPQTGVSYPVPVLAELAKIPNVVGIKAASARAEVYAELWDALNDKLAVLAAVDSPPLYDMLMHGSHGALIGISAVVPEKWAELLRYTEAGDAKKATALFDKVCRPLMASIFENQQPVRLTNEAAAMKEALVHLGQIPHSRVRPPAVGVDKVVSAEIKTSLVDAGLL
jgi:4-hydroxy-tetrahydrodipicolinate synthase